MLTHWLTLAAVVLVAALVQSAAGFGLGIVAIPLLLWAGTPLPEAIGFALGATTVQLVIALILHRKLIQWRSAAPLATLQWIGVPLGVLTMQRWLLHHAAQTKATIGGILLAFLIARLLWKPVSRQRFHTGWARVAAASAGFLGGLVGMGGPPLVLFAMAQDWQKERFRVFLWTQFCLGLPVLLLILITLFGPPILHSFGKGLLLTPVVYLGTRAGLLVSAHWSRRQVHAAANLLLFALASGALLGAVLGR